MTKKPEKSMTDNFVIYSRYDKHPRKAWVQYPEPAKPVLQGGAPECDINNIVRRLRQGLDPGVPINGGSYRDNSEVVDMKSNLDIIRAHESRFNELPEHLQEKFRTPLGYYNAELQALAESQRTSNPLDVTGPTDSKSPVSTKKGAKNETESATSSNRKKSVQTSDGDSPEE